VVGDATTAADTYTTTVGAETAALVSWATSNDNTATLLASAIDALASYSAVANTNVVTVTADTAGAAGNTTISTVTTDGGGGGVVPTAVDTELTGGTDAGTLTNDFVALGVSSNKKIYGATDTIALADSTVNYQTLRKTVVVGSNMLANAPVGVDTQSVIGKYKFTSTGEDLGDSSVLKSVTVKLTGGFIASSAGDGNVTVNIYNGSVDANNLMGTGTIGTVDAGTSVAAAITLNSKNEWTGDLDLLVVVDTTDTDFVDTSGNDALATKITTFTWNDGSIDGIPVAGIPVTGGTLTY